MGMDALLPATQGRKRFLHKDTDADLATRNTPRQTRSWRMKGIHHGGFGCCSSCGVCSSHENHRKAILPVGLDLYYDRVRRLSSLSFVEQSGKTPRGGLPSILACFGTHFHPMNVVNFLKAGKDIPRRPIRYTSAAARPGKEPGESYIYASFKANVRRAESHETRARREGDTTVSTRLRMHESKLFQVSRAQRYSYDNKES